MPLTILVIDDEISLERLIKLYFKSQIRAGEYQFIFARNGQEAWEILQSDRGIDLVLTDLNMPKMDGWTLISLVKSENFAVKIVIVSAYGDPANLNRAKEIGVFDFLTKPIDFEELEKTIQRSASSDRQYLDPERCQPKS